MCAKRLNTALESEGAEFLVLGNLLIQGVPAYKSYRHNIGHDLVAVNPDRNTSVRLEVKSRWASDAHWNMGMKEAGATDFYVYVRLNRGNRYGSAPAKDTAPHFYVIPEKTADGLPKTGWGQARLKHLPDVELYRDRWDLIIDFLGRV
ncbi:hypothetical protein [Pelagibius sp.]|uniref:hypothetical protein n=1 Tax=Pelagibius sp. TaxID=1931238 RepID=UPI00262CCF16|nr:hypothetical protein [Pelagibius sp.]